MKPKAFLKNASRQDTASDALNIVFAVNDCFGMQLAVALYSLLENTPLSVRLNIIVLGRGIKKRTRKKIEKIISGSAHNVSLEWAGGDTISLEGLPQNISSHLPPETYLRLFLPSVLPGAFEKILYLDADIVVMADVSQLFDVSMEGKTLLAVRNFGFSDIIQGMPQLFATMPCPPETPYYNTGVMLIDLKRWREMDYSLKAMIHAKRFSHLIKWGDQDVINALLAGDIGSLDEMWNVQVAACLNYDKWEESTFKASIGPRLKSLLNPPCILHFVGPWKPWKPGFDNRFQNVYFRCLAACGWFSPIGFYAWYSLWLIKGVAHMITALFSMKKHRSPAKKSRMAAGNKA